MDFKKYAKEFQDKASNVGYTSENIKRCLDYAEILIKSDLPVIYNTSHLSALVGYRKEYIKRAVIYTPHFYRDFKVKKKNGDFRFISEPLPSLKEIQEWILINILEKIEVSSFAKAYRKKVKLIENVRFHTNQPKLVTLDLKDFFSSIKTKHVQEIFLSLGYSFQLSNLLSKLCTKENCLPQGAPTSPYISNIFFRNVDEMIIKYCLPKNIRYTRYADDLSFSGDFDEIGLISFVEEKITPLNLSLQKEKLKIMMPNQRQTVKGIVVNKKPQVVYHKRNNIRLEMYYIMKFGFKNHMRFKNIKKSNYLEHLLGKINFVLHLNPNDREFLKYKENLITLKEKNSK